MRAILVEEPGQEDLNVVEMPDPEPREGHELVTVLRAGVTYADIRMRENTYVAPVTYPHVPGRDLVGVTQEGRRVVALTESGAYAEKALVNRGLCWEIPDDITDDQAIALALPGLSAWHILHTTLDIKDGETVLIPGAVSAFGSLAIQLAKRAGANVVAMTLGESRAELARTLGADAVVDLNNAAVASDTVIHFDDLPGSPADRVTGRHIDPRLLADLVLDAAGGPVDAAMDARGGDYFTATLTALAPRGRMAVFGCHAGRRSEVSQEALIFGSKTVSGFWLPDHYDNLYALRNTMNALFAATAMGVIKPLIGHRYSLKQAGTAQTVHGCGATACTPDGKIMIDMRPVSEWA
ncbi:zinc-binding alcohol dehydrogenase family protein [Streptomyces luteireticuli]|uniref:quinone oxidoreductase family protein n=1 Tax=Streptomyces luteireticuli TaxID=173858 RepID=UPI003555DB8A